MEELRRSFTPASVTLLPEDHRLPRASWQGEPGLFGPVHEGAGAAGSHSRCGRRPGRAKVGTASDRPALQRYESLRLATAERIEELKLDPERSPEDVRQVITELVGAYQRTAHAGRSLLCVTRGRWSSACGSR